MRNQLKAIKLIDDPRIKALVGQKPELKGNIDALQEIVQDGDVTQAEAKATLVPTLTRLRGDGFETIVTVLREALDQGMTMDEPARQMFGALAQMSAGFELGDRTTIVPPPDVVVNAARLTEQYLGKSIDSFLPVGAQPAGEKRERYQSYNQGAEVDTLERTYNLPELGGLQIRRSTSFTPDGETVFSDRLSIPPLELVADASGGVTQVVLPDLKTWFEGGVLHRSYKLRTTESDPRHTLVIEQLGPDASVAKQEFFRDILGGED
jgi:hypothetical protein